MTDLNSLPDYESCDDLWCVTAYFNPCGYRSRRENYRIFSERLQAAGLPLVTIECAFGEVPFDLPAGPNVIQVRAKDVLWQKERLLNIAVARLPAHVCKVALLDGDILFTNPAWARETSRLLDEFPIVQPFTHVVRLGPAQSADGEPAVEGFASVWTKDRTALHQGWFKHGHTGYGWAFRRDLLERHGLYDAHLGGVGDHVMAHAMGGDFEAGCLRETFRTSLRETLQRHESGRFLRRWAARLVPRFAKDWVHRRTASPVNQALWVHYLAWSRAFSAEVQGRLRCTPGTVWHLWHGEPAARRYQSMTSILIKHGFDPAADLRRNTDGCWEWASDKPALHAGVQEYFSGREEDES